MSLKRYDKSGRMPLTSQVVSNRLQEERITPSSEHLSKLHAQHDSLADAQPFALLRLRASIDPHAAKVRVFPLFLFLLCHRSSQKQRLSVCAEYGFGHAAFCVE